MTTDQISHILGLGGTVTSVMSTRNGIFNTAGGHDRDPLTGRYRIVEWDDANELLVLEDNGQRPIAGQLPLRHYISYPIIDEMEVAPAP